MSAIAFPQVLDMRVADLEAKLKATRDEARELRAALRSQDLELRDVRLSEQKLRSEVLHLKGASPRAKSSPQSSGENQVSPRQFGHREPPKMREIPPHLKLPHAFAQLSGSSLSSRERPAQPMYDFSRPYHPPNSARSKERPISREQRLFNSQARRPNSSPLAGSPRASIPMHKRVPRRNVDPVLEKIFPWGANRLTTQSICDEVTQMLLGKQPPAPSWRPTAVLNDHPLHQTTPVGLARGLFHDPAHRPESVYDTRQYRHSPRPPTAPEQSTSTCFSSTYLQDSPTVLAASAPIPPQPKAPKRFQSTARHPKKMARQGSNQLLLRLPGGHHCVPVPALLELGSYRRPNAIATKLLEAVGLVIQPDRHTSAADLTIVNAVQKILRDPKRFADLLKERDWYKFAAGSVPGLLQEYVQDPEFTPQRLAHVSVAAADLCSWIIFLASAPPGSELQ
eukprot:CAMPEP_0114544468 /NCGR_PEP_ID=MMETSP0114-20121206/2893_1 /TAXON_ID=31324 /ORGANISM="Goniomonas sp, Strain m" /LENGTH=451 /DNA_ID=CAMNT_0001728851 /DNA_START=9 /DNA_END=1364 /DNA_ORIENTATION=-